MHTCVSVKLNPTSKRIQLWHRATSAWPNVPSLKERQLSQELSVVLKPRLQTARCHTGSYEALNKGQWQDHHCSYHWERSLLLSFDSMGFEAPTHLPPRKLTFLASVLQNLTWTYKTEGLTESDHTTTGLTLRQCIRKCCQIRRDLRSWKPVERILGAASC